MKKLVPTAVISALCVAALSFGIAVSAQQQAKVEMAARVKQGDSVTFRITTNQPASVPTDIAVRGVDGAGDPINFSEDILNDKLAVLSYRVPLNAPTGTWKILKVQASPVGGGAVTDLLTHGDLSFQVVPHDPVVLPSSAAVEIN